jgi:hypothetical protein
LTAFSHVSGNDCFGFTEVVFEGAVFGGLGVSFEDADGDVLGGQRLVEGVEQVLAGKKHFFSFEF